MPIKIRKFWTVNPTTKVKKSKKRYKRGDNKKIIEKELKERNKI